MTRSPCVLRFYSGLLVDRSVGHVQITVQLTIVAVNLACDALDVMQGRVLGHLGLCRIASELYLVFIP